MLLICAYAAERHSLLYEMQLYLRELELRPMPYEEHPLPCLWHAHVRAVELENLDIIPDTPDAVYDAPHVALGISLDKSRHVLKDKAFRSQLLYCVARDKYKVIKSLLFLPLAEFLFLAPHLFPESAHGERSTRRGHAQKVKAIQFIRQVGAVIEDAHVLRIHILRMMVKDIRVRHFWVELHAAECVVPSEFVTHA